MLKFLLIFPIAGAYFFVSWFTPWHELAPGSTISASYLFDLVFILSVFAWNKKLIFFGEMKFQSFLARLAMTFLLAIGCLFVLINSQIQTPFKYVDHLILQMLILAPLIEEFVYRESFFVILKRLTPNKNFALILNSLLFGLSHISGIFLLPAEFHTFIYAQVIYTIPLGWICAKARDRTDGIAEPIVLHLLFNLLFYIAVANFSM